MEKIKLNIPYRDSYNFLELYDLIITSSLSKEVKYFGSKEIMCEEFIPYFIANNTKITVIIRDPRDVAASINYPDRTKYLGDKKPTLFILKNWRRTIDYIRHYQNNSNLFHLKYEDLVNLPYKILGQITDFLEITPFKKNYFENGICDREGKKWKSNSSFGRQTAFISSGSIGKYKGVLSKEEVNYIETICYSEMKHMNYDFVTTPDKNIISRFKDKQVKNSEYLDKNYSSLQNNIDEELKKCPL